MTGQYAWYGAISYDEDAVPAGIEITGLDEVMQTVGQICIVAHDRAMNRLRQNGERILAEADKRVPVDMTYESRMVSRFRNIGNYRYLSGISKVRGRMRGGLLRSTGTLEPVPDDENSIQIGYNTPYAHRQHEDLTLRHTRPGATAKYLEGPALEIAPTIPYDIAEYLGDVLR
jgi:hypothetical protein